MAEQPEVIYLARDDSGAFVARVWVDDVTNRVEAAEAVNGMAYPATIYIHDIRQNPPSLVFTETVQPGGTLLRKNITGPPAQRNRDFYQISAN